MGKNSLQHIVRLILMGLLMYPGILSAQGDLLITPRRVVFEGNKRSTDISLANIGKDTATYSISRPDQDDREWGI